MKLLIDTSVAIAYGAKEPLILERLVTFKARDEAISAISLLEPNISLKLGDGRAENRAQIRATIARFPVLDFDAKAAACAAALFARHEIKGDRAPVFDGLIAAHAQSLDVPIAYIDGDFNRFAIKKQLRSRD